MKKIVFILTVMAALVAGTTANAQKETVKTVKAEKSVQTTQPGFVDSNGDGVCDHYDGTQPGKGLGPGNGKGEGRATGQRKGKQQGLRDGSGLGERQLNGTGPHSGQRSSLRDGSGPNCKPRQGIKK
jgi:hypothetical protein